MASESMPRREKWLLGGLSAVAALVAMAACDPEADASPATETVDGVEYPICEQEDCSDQPGQIGVWINSEGERWLSVGEYSLHIEPEINHGPAYWGQP
jgi:hypothetical protein